MTGRRWLLLGVAAAAALLLVGRVLADTYADYLWYDALGAAALWRTRLLALTVLRVGSFVLAAGFTFVNLIAVRRSVVSLVLQRQLGNIEIGEEVPSRYLLVAGLVISIIAGILLAIPQGDWSALVLAHWGAAFRESDPYTSANLGYFVYRLAFESELWTWALMVLVTTIVAVLVVYALTPSLRWERGALYASAYVRRHATVLLGCVLLLLAWSFRLDMYGLLVQGSGADGAFTFVDHRIGIPGDLVLALLTLGASITVIWAGLTGQLRLAGVSVIAVLVVALVVRQVVPAISRHHGTDAERAARELPYLDTRAAFSRRAYATDAITLASATLAYPDVATALSRSAAWDAPALVRVADGMTGPAGEPVGVGWQSTQAGLAAVVVQQTVRSTADPDDRAPWMATRLLAAQADDRGSPVRVDAAGRPTADAIVLEPPIVYPGASGFLIVSDSLNRMAGSTLTTSLGRLAYAWSLQDFARLLGDLPQPRPTLVDHRDVRDRVGLLAPFFTQGRTVTPVVLGDSLFWSVDLYATSDSYPLSRHLLLGGDEVSYVHHAAVAIVLAATGDVVMIPDSTLDPIAETWVRHFPSLFSRWTALPAGLRDLIPAPRDGLYTQAAAFGLYGRGDDSVASRRLPVLDGADSALAGPDLPMLLTGSQSAAVALPLVDATDRIMGLLVESGGGAPSTQWFPLTTPGLRWASVIDKLRTLDSAGTDAIDAGVIAHGRIRVAPVGPSLAFFQPTYRWAPQTLPQLNRIAVLSGDSLRSVAPVGPPADSLPRARPAASPKVADALRDSVRALYVNMRDALRRGDWTTFGRAFEALGRLTGQPRIQ
jgi:uncharacterized membrane protein (UPF0182 family)